MANSDPQSQRKRTWGELLSGGEASAVKKAEYKRGMGIDPANKRIQNVEVSASAKSMQNPTSRPARTEPSREAKKRSASGTYTKPYDKKREAAGTYTKSYDTKREAAGTYTKPYDVKRGASGTYTKPYDVKEKKNVASAPAPDKKGSANKPTAKKTGQKASAGSTKMSAFERMKARQYEKEGYGGRAMTAAQARARVEKERGSKVSVPGFSKVKEALKGAASKVQGAAKKSTAKPATKMAKPEYKSQKARDFAAKMQGRNRSGKADSKFKFKDLFK